MRFIVVLLASTIAAAAAPVVDPDGPFVIGEAFPETPATCGSLRGWLDDVPDYDGRISMAIEGELLASEYDGVLAYLFMCPEQGVQVICVTYEPHEIVKDQKVLLAGGFAGTADGQVILDPCLAYDIPGQRA